MIEFRPSWKAVVGALALLAVASSAVLYGWASKDWKVIWPVLATAFTVSGVVGFGWLFFNRWLWRVECRKHRVLGFLAPQPDLNGRWVGVMRSPHIEALIPVAIEVCQTYATIDCQIWTGSNRSFTLSASLLCSQERRNFRLLYTFSAEASAGFESDDHRHIGTVVLELAGPRRDARLAGWYFTDRNIPESSPARRTRGEMFLMFESKKTKGSLGGIQAEALAYLCPTTL